MACADRSTNPSRTQLQREQCWSNLFHGKLAARRWAAPLAARRCEPTTSASYSLIVITPASNTELGAKPVHGPQREGQLGGAGLGLDRRVALVLVAPREIPCLAPILLIAGDAASATATRAECLPSLQVLQLLHRRR